MAGSGSESGKLGLLMVMDKGWEEKGRRGGENGTGGGVFWYSDQLRAPA